MVKADRFIGVNPRHRPVCAATHCQGDVIGKPFFFLTRKRGVKSSDLDPLRRTGDKRIDGACLGTRYEVFGAALQTGRFHHIGITVTLQAVPLAAYAAIDDVAVLGIPGNGDHRAAGRTDHHAYTAFTGPDNLLYGGKPRPLKEGVQQGGIKLTAVFCFQCFYRRYHGHPPAVGACAREGVESIGDADDSCKDGYLIALETTG